MKKIIYLASLLFAFWACDNNDIKMFEKENANVYFPEKKIGVVVGQRISIPINLANLRGGESRNVKIQIKDSTAVEGVDFIIVSGYSYTFKEGVGIEYIVIEALKQEDDLLSRKIFTISLEPTDGLCQNVQNTMIVEVRNYSNHPLKKLLGDGSFVGADIVAQKEFTFPVSLYPDPDNESVIWLAGMTGAGYGGVLPDIQLNVDTLRRKIILPYQSFQTLKIESITGDIESFKGVVSGGTVWINAKSDVMISYDKNGNLFFDDWFGMWWTSGSMLEQPLFIYYGNYGGGYNTAIMKK